MIVPTTIPLFKVSIPTNITEVLAPVLSSGFITEGPKAKQFEQEFQQWIGNPNTAIVNSGTSALTIAMRLAGVGPGTEVITSPMTCLATNEPILSLGAIPVWCDVDPTTGNIDVNKIEALITSRTKAILFVDWAGTPAELNEIITISIKHGIKTIEDAAHSLGAGYMTWKVGTVCDYTCFSFQAIKHMTTIDGGAIACRAKEDYERAILLRWFGCARGHNNSPVKWTGDVTEYGWKMHMNDVNATIGIEQLKTVRSRIDLHKRNGQLMTKHLSELDCNCIELIKIPIYIDSSYWIYTLKFRDKAMRDMVSKKLSFVGIGNGIVHTRNDEYSLFAPYKKELPGLDDFAARMLNIPCGWWCSEQDIELIANYIKKFTT